MKKDNSRIRSISHQRITKKNLPVEVGDETSDIPFCPTTIVSLIFSPSQVPYGYLLYYHFRFFTKIHFVDRTHSL